MRSKIVVRLDELRGHLLPTAVDVPQLGQQPSLLRLCSNGYEQRSVDVNVLQPGIPVRLPIRYGSVVDNVGDQPNSVKCDGGHGSGVWTLKYSQNRPPKFHSTFLHQTCGIQYLIHLDAILVALLAPVHNRTLVSVLDPTLDAALNPV